MSRIGLAAALMTCVLLLRAAPAHAAPAELLSLIGLPVEDGQYVSGFELQTWTVEVLAVCRLPTGWSVTAGNGGDPGGVLSGSANIGAAYLGKDRLDALGSLFLVRIGRYRAQPADDSGGLHYPAAFAGTATIGLYGQEAEHKIALSGRNIRRRPADHCPAPSH